jgi:hypothetical protein
MAEYVKEESDTFLGLYTLEDNTFFGHSSRKRFVAR